MKDFLILYTKILTYILIVTLKKNVYSYFYDNVGTFCFPFLRQDIQVMFETLYQLNKTQLMYEYSKEYKTRINHYTHKLSKQTSCQRISLKILPAIQNKPM